VTGHPAAGNSEPVGVVRHRTHLMPGRPYRVSVRVSEAEWRLIDAAARAAGLTPSGYVGKAAVAASGREDAPSAGLVDGLRELQRELFAARRAVNMFAANVNQAAAAFHATGRLPVWVEDAVGLCRGAVGRLDAVTARIDRRLR
jgi:hypothetical protein